MSKSKLLVAVAFGAAMAATSVLGPAVAASSKTCTTTTADDPSKNWQTQTTNTQTSSCNSNSDTGFTDVSTTTSNPGGKQPPAKN